MRSIKFIGRTVGWFVGILTGLVALSFLMILVRKFTTVVTEHHGGFVIGFIVVVVLVAAMLLAWDK